MNSVEEIFKANYKELCVTAYYYLKDISEAEDLVQDIFVKIIEQHKVEQVNNMVGYLRAAVRNESLKRIKKRGQTQPIEENMLFYNETATEEENALALKKKIELYKQIEALPEQCKKVFLLSVVDDLKYQEVADTLNISINTVKTQMKKAFKTLREVLKDTQFFLFLLSDNNIFNINIKKK